MKWLIVEPFAGLGNRIRALVSAIRLAKKLNRQLGILWTLDSYHCWCPFQNLFENAFVFVSSYFLQDIVNVKYLTIGKSPNYISVTDEHRIIVVREENFFWLDSDTDVMWGQFGPLHNNKKTERGPSWHAELTDVFRQLRPHPAIQKRVNDFCVDLPADTIGVHVRREDNEWSNKYCPDWAFVFRFQMDPALAGASKILLATDSEQTEQVFRKRFGKRIITFPVRSLARGKDFSAIEDAFCTMLALARTRLIVRSCSSTFSQCSAWLGQKPTLDIGKKQHVH